LPDVAGTYVGQLQVTAGEQTDIDTVTITVSANEVPVADASSDQSVVNGETVILDGTGSFNLDNAPQPLNYEWSIISAPANSLAIVNNADSATASFTPDLVGIYEEVRLTVSDGADSATNTFVITLNEVIIEPLTCDINNDKVVNSRDITVILSIINTQADRDSDPSDCSGDSVVNVLVVSGCILQCTLPGCAVTSN
jgi:hypothetical protein